MRKGRPSKEHINKRKISTPVSAFGKLAEKSSPPSIETTDEYFIQSKCEDEIDIGDL
jgi:hypothetical protein